MLKWSVTILISLAVGFAVGNLSPRLWPQYANTNECILDKIADAATNQAVGLIRKACEQQYGHQAKTNPYDQFDND